MKDKIAFVLGGGGIVSVFAGVVSYDPKGTQLGAPLLLICAGLVMFVVSFMIGVSGGRR